jgi:hypothetical protein
MTALVIALGVQGWILALYFFLETRRARRQLDQCAGPASPPPEKP